MNNEEKILEILEKMQSDIKQLQSTQDRTILAVTELQEDMKSMNNKVDNLVTKEEYLTGQDIILKKLDTLETEKVFTDSRLRRIEAKIG